MRLSGSKPIGLTCTFECHTVLLSFVSYESYGKATSDNGE